MRCILGAECCFRSAGWEAGAGDGGNGKPASDFGRADRRRRGRLPRDTGGGIAVGNGVGNRTGSAGAPGMRGLCRFGDDTWRGCMPVVRRGGTVRGCGAVGCEGDFFRKHESAFCEVCTQGAAAGEESSAQRIGKSGSGPGRWGAAGEPNAAAIGRGRFDVRFPGAVGPAASSRGAVLRRAHAAGGFGSGSCGTGRRPKGGWTERGRWLRISRKTGTEPI